MLCFAIAAQAQNATAGPTDSTPEKPESQGAVDAAARLPAIDLLDLAKAQEMAVRDNPSIKAAEARILQAQARVKQAQAAWFPHVFVTAAASNTWISENDYEFAKRAASNGYWSSFALGTQARLQGEVAQFAQIVANGIAATFNPVPHAIQSPPMVTNTDQAIVRDLLTTSIYSIDARHAVKDELEAYTISVVAEWIVFNGFDRKFAIAEARFGREQTEASYLEAHRILLDAVARAYYAAQLARENIAIAEADEGFNQLQLKQAQLRKEAGTGSKSDVLNFEVRVNAARAALISARQSYATARIALAELLALPDATFPDTMDLAPLEEASLETLEPPDPELLVAYAKEHRPDLRTSELAVNRADATIGRAKAPFYPSISAQVSKDGVRHSDFEFGEDDFSTTIGVSGSYELFAGGRNLARLRETKAARAEARHLAAQAELAVASEVRRNVEELRAAQERLVLQRANAVYVQQNRDLVEKGYNGGVEPLVRLNEAQRDLVEAQANLAFARVQLQSSWHNVRTASGETVQRVATPAVSKTKRDSAQTPGQ